MFREFDSSEKRTEFIHDAMKHLVGMFTENFQRVPNNQQTQQIYQVLQMFLDFGVGYRPFDDLY
jgi:hypothetical protein